MTSEPADPAGADAPAAADPRSVTAALARAALLGDYFRITAGPAAGAWRPAAAAYRDGMPDLTGHTARRLGTTEHRIAVSIAHLGYAARIWSPGLACALQAGIVPDLYELAISAELPVRLRLARPGGWQAAEPAALAGLLYRTVVEQHLEPLAVGLDAGIAAGLLWGNAASALAGALGVLVRAEPGLAEPARALADLLIGTGRLRGTGHFAGPGIAFRRHSCCLYYRVPGGGMCGDCSLLRVHS